MEDVAIVIIHISQLWDFATDFTADLIKVCDDRTSNVVVCLRWVLQWWLKLLVLKMSIKNN